MDDLQRRLALAKRVGATHSIVDTLVALKEKSELEMFANRLDNGTAEKFYAENALKNMVKIRFFKISHVTDEKFTFSDFKVEGSY